VKHQFFALGPVLGMAFYGWTGRVHCVLYDERLHVFFSGARAGPALFLAREPGLFYFWRDRDEAVAMPRSKIEMDGLEMNVIDGYLPLDLIGAVGEYYDMNWVLKPVIRKEVDRMSVGLHSLYEERLLASDIDWLLHLYDNDGNTNWRVVGFANDIIRRCELHNKMKLARYLGWLRDYNNIEF
jgi:hypothetical protein